NGSGDQDGSTLFVKNIASSVDKDMLSEMFPGSTEIRMPTKHDGSPKGFAYLEFDDPKKVKKYLETKQGRGA
uniref:RRM domain-containing protein n=1 Tax=Magallana gigas TaxID=29159 RepID=A0A8W8IAY0_MAGGI